MQHSTFEIIVAVAVTVTAIANGVMLMLIYVVLRRLSATAETTRRRLEPILRDTEHLVSQTRQGVGEILRDVRVSVRFLTTTAEEISEMASSQAREIRALARDTVLVARNQVERVDEVLTRTTERFDHTAASLQRQVLEPARELHYLVVAVKRALRVLFSRQPPPPGPTYQDEELFI
ncbi:MAG: hypothetical protein HY650_08825 [Acidobacteria bacterium]|nr:hypothetical protein [Acidobacteriota bacterium]